MAPGHRRRVRDKLLRYGVESLYDYEFLELYLFNAYKLIDTRSIARNLIEEFGNLEKLCDASIEEMMKIKGVGQATAEYIKMLPYICKGYLMHTSMKVKETYDTKADIEKRCVALLQGSTNEKAYILCFDNRKRLVKEVEISEGDPGGVDISVRRIMDAIANTATTSVMICHNHPSGAPTPSQSDFVATSAIVKMLETVGVELLDHLVVFGDRFVSCIPVKLRGE